MKEIKVLWKTDIFKHLLRRFLTSFMFDYIYNKSCFFSNSYLQIHFVIFVFVANKRLHGQNNQAKIVVDGLWLVTILFLKSPKNRISYFSQNLPVKKNPGNCFNLILWNSLIFRTLCVHLLFQSWTFSLCIHCETITNKKILRFSKFNANKILLEKIFLNFDSL